MRQTVVILRKLTDDLGFSYNAPEIQAIKERMSCFVRNGDSWKGVMSLAPWGREAVLEMEGNTIEMTLRVLGTKRGKVR